MTGLPTPEQIAAAHDDSTDFDHPAETIELAVFIHYLGDEPRLLRIRDGARTDYQQQLAVQDRRAAVHRERGAAVHKVYRRRLVTYTPWEKS